MNYREIQGHFRNKNQGHFNRVQDKSSTRNADFVFPMRRDCIPNCNLIPVGKGKPCEKFQELWKPLDKIVIFFAELFLLDDAHISTSFQDWPVFWKKSEGHSSSIPAYKTKVQLTLLSILFSRWLMSSIIFLFFLQKSKFEG